MPTFFLRNSRHDACVFHHKWSVAAFLWIIFMTFNTKHEIRFENGFLYKIQYKNSFTKKGLQLYNVWRLIPHTLSWRCVGVGWWGGVVTRHLCLLIVVFRFRLGSMEKVPYGVSRDPCNEKVQSIELPVAHLGLFLFLHLHPDSTTHRFESCLERKISIEKWAHFSNCWGGVASTYTPLISACPLVDYWLKYRYRYWWAFNGVYTVPLNWGRTGQDRDSVLFSSVYNKIGSCLVAFRTNGSTQDPAVKAAEIGFGILY